MHMHKINKAIRENIFARHLKRANMSINTDVICKRKNWKGIDKIILKNYAKRNRNI